MIAVATHAVKPKAPLRFASAPGQGGPDAHDYHAGRVLFAVAKAALKPWMRLRPRAPGHRPRDAQKTHAGRGVL
jgi:hypothetical protein